MVTPDRVTGDKAAFETWLENAVTGYVGLFGVRMKIEAPAELTVSCNLYRTTLENALACYHALQAVLGNDVAEWGVTVDVALFRSQGASNDN